MIGGTTRTGNPKKGPQKHQNIYKFKPNKYSKKSKSLGGTPLDKLCKRCYEKVKWKLDFHKYKPLKEPGKCTKCEEKNVIKAYRMFCDNCATKNKICSKCGEKIDEFYHAGIRITKDQKLEKIEEILSTVREREKRSIMRAILKGEIDYDPDKGLVYTGKEGGEVKLKKKKTQDDDMDAFMDDDDDLIDKDEPLDDDEEEKGNGSDDEPE